MDMRLALLLLFLCYFTNEVVGKKGKKGYRVNNRGGAVGKHVPKNNSGDENKPEKKKEETQKPTDINVNVNTNNAEANKKILLDKLRKVNSNEDFFDMVKSLPKTSQMQFQRVILKSTKPVITSSSDLIKEAKPNIGWSFTMKDENGNVLHDATEPIKLESLFCLPRPTVYSVEASHLYFNYPACFHLNQCGGCCNNKPNYVCRPTELQNEQATVFRLMINDMSVQPTQITLHHHKACACQCKLQQSDCLPTEILDSVGCYCVCARTETACPSVKHQWSDTKCGCVCKSVQQDCEKKKQWDADRCECRCKPVPCPWNQVQDPSTCYCAKMSIQ